MLIWSKQSYLGKIIDIVSRDAHEPEQKADALGALLNTILEIALIVIVGTICTILRGWLFDSSAERVVARLRKNLFSHLIDQEIAFYDVNRTGELLSRLSEDTQIIKGAATTNLSEALRNVATMAMGIGFMISSSWKLTLLSLAVVPALFVVVYHFGRYIRDLSHKTQAAAAVAASIAEVFMVHFFLHHYQNKIGIAFSEAQLEERSTSLRNKVVPKPKEIGGAPLTF